MIGPVAKQAGRASTRAGSYGVPLAGISTVSAKGLNPPQAIAKIPKIHPIAEAIGQLYEAEAIETGYLAEALVGN